MQFLRLACTVLALIVAPLAVQAAERKQQEPPVVQEVAPPSLDAMPEVDPVTLYGGELIFDVYRKGKHIGEHHVAFSRDGDKLVVDARFNLKVNVFLFTYDFDYESQEIWDGKTLNSVASKVNDNGKHTVVNATHQDGLFKIDSTRRQAVTTHWVFPTNHWNKGQAASSVILNTLNGRLNNVEVVRRGIETVETQQGPVEAERFEYTGELRDTEAWYDAQGRWVALRFKAKDGSIIQHVCRQCGHAQTAQLQ